MDQSGAIQESLEREENCVLVSFFFFSLFFATYVTQDYWTQLKRDDLCRATSEWTQRQKSDGRSDLLTVKSVQRDWKSVCFDSTRSPLELQKPLTWSNLCSETFLPHDDAIVFKYSLNLPRHILYTGGPQSRGTMTWVIFDQIDIIL